MPAESKIHWAFCLKKQYIFIFKSIIKSMAAYMILFWAFFFVFLVSAILVFSRRLGHETKDFVSNIYFFSIIMMGLFFIAILATDDPFLEYLPLLQEIWEAGWEVGLTIFILGFTLPTIRVYLKKEYLSPMRKSITKLQIGFSRLDERTKGLDERTKNMDKKLDLLLTNTKK